MKFVDKIILKKPIKEAKPLSKKKKISKEKVYQSRLKLPKNWIHGRLR